MGLKYSHLDTSIDNFYTYEDYLKMKKYYNMSFCKMSEDELNLFHSLRVLVEFSYRNKFSLDKKLYCEYKNRLVRHYGKKSIKEVLNLPTSLENREKFICNYKKIENY